MIQDHQNRGITALCALLLISPCLSYAILGDAPLISFLAIIFLILSLVKKYPIRITTRSVVYSVTVSLIFTVVLNLTYPVDGDRFFSPLPTEVVFPFLISLGICGTFFYQDHKTLTIILTSAVLAMCLQGSCVNDPTNVRLTIPFEPWQNRFWIFGFFLALQMCAFIPLLYFAQEKRGNNVYLRPGKKRFRAVLYSGSFGLLVCLILIFCNVATRVEKMMEPVFNSLFTMYISSFRSKIIFGSEVDLYRKVASHIQKNKSKVVLRAKSDGPPGYLRGRVYTSYFKGKWQSDQSENVTRLPVMTNDRGSVSNRFYRGKRESDVVMSELSTIDIFPSRFFYSDVLLATGNTQVVEMVAESLECSRDGVFFPKSWDRDGAYTISVENDNDSSAYQTTIAHTDQLKRLLKVSDANLANQLKRIGYEVGVDSSKDSLQKIRQIESYLLSNFRYDLGTVMEGTFDPILEFLEEKKSGHCELFATAAALLLRSQGIPTRYVTGFVSVESHPIQGHWIARLGDCHAWVEAWLPEKKEWILVEATPPVGVPQGMSNTGRISQIKESWIIFWQDMYAQVKRGYFAEAVLTILVGVGSFLTWVFWRGPWYLSWGILLFSLGILFRFLMKRTRRRTSFYESNYTQFNSIYLDIESCLRKGGIHRTKTMSIRDLIVLISEKKLPMASEVTSLLSDYECLRYSPNVPDMRQVKRLKERVRSWKDSD